MSVGICSDDTGDRFVKRLNIPVSRLQGYTFPLVDLMVQHGGTRNIADFLKYGLIGLVLIAVVAAGGIYFWQSRHSYMNIYDAQVSSLLVGAKVQADGTITEMMVGDGDHVEAGDVIAHVQVKVTDEQIDQLQQEVRDLKAENEKLKHQIAASAAEGAGSDVTDVNGVKILVMKVDGVQMNELRDLGDQMKAKTDDGVVVLASSVDGKVNLIVMAGEAAQKKGAHAGNIVKGIAGLVGGGGGGRPNMAQAGGKNPAGIDAALEKAKEILAGQIG